MVSTPHRDSLNGAWILDKSRPDWSINPFLAVMKVNQDALDAHDKGEHEYDTIHTVQLNRKTLFIRKQSRVNNNVTIELELGKESIQQLAPGQRLKSMLAVSNDSKHLRIESRLETVYGVAHIVDSKQLIPDEQVMKQELVITAASTGETASVVRYFLPYDAP